MGIPPPVRGQACSLLLDLEKVKAENIRKYQVRPVHLSRGNRPGHQELGGLPLGTPGPSPRVGDGGVGLWASTLLLGRF